MYLLIFHVVLNNILLCVYFIVSDLYSDCFIPINCFSFSLITYNNVLCVRSILLGVLTLNLYQWFLLLFHQTQSISTTYIELKSNGSTRTNMPLSNCALFCPLLPLQDYLLQGWYSSSTLYFCWAFYHIITVNFATPCFCSRKQW